MKRTIPLIAMTVSYTHLDVYKRQVQFDGGPPVRHAHGT